MREEASASIECFGYSRSLPDLSLRPVTLSFLLPFVLLVCGILPLCSFFFTCCLSLFIPCSCYLFFFFCLPSFSMRSVRFSSAIVLVSALLFLRASWFLMFRGVLLLCCAFFPFLAPVFSVSFFFILDSLLFQLGARAFEGEASHSSPLLRFIIDSS